MDVYVRPVIFIDENEERWNQVISESGIEWLLERLPKFLRAPEDLMPYRRKETTEQRVNRLFREGKSKDEIQRETDVSRRWVNKILAKAKAV